MIQATTDRVLGHNEIQCALDKYGTQRQYIIPRIEPSAMTFPILLKGTKRFDIIILWVLILFFLAFIKFIMCTKTPNSKLLENTKL